jgi:hypothetical protein
MKTKELVLILAITLLFTFDVQAESMRCGSHVIEDGDLHNAITMQEVIEKCGQPSSRKGNTLYYKTKGKELHFDTNDRLMAIREIEED